MPWHCQGVITAPHRKERSGLIFKIIIGAKNRNRLFSVSQSATRQSVALCLRSSFRSPCRQCRVSPSSSLITLLANRKWHMPAPGQRNHLYFYQIFYHLESLGEKEREWTERRTRQNGRHRPALVGAGWLAGWPRRWPQRTRQNPISRERSSGARRPQFFLTFLYFALAHHAAHFSTHHKP